MRRWGTGDMDEREIMAIPTAKAAILKLPLFLHQSPIIFPHGHRLMGDVVLNESSMAGGQLYK